MRKSALFLAALLLPAAAGAQEWRGPAAIEVQVEDAKGRNLAGAEVLLVYLSPDGGGSLPSVLTDASGKANIGGLAAGRWSAEIRHAGHMSYRAELALSADGKPAVQSASHIMAPGAVSTMKVKFSRGRGGAPAPAAPAPVAVAPMPPAAAEKAPVKEAPAVPPLAPAPVSAAAEEKPPGRALPPVAPAAGAPAPAPAPAPAKPPVQVSPPVPSVAPAPAPEAKPPAVPTASPAPVRAPAVATENPPVKAVPQAPAVAPAPAAVQAPAVPAQPLPVTPAPLPAAATPSAPPPPVVAPAPAPPAPVAAAAPARARLCVECPPGESAAWGEAAIAGGAAAGCPTDLAARLKTIELEAVAQLSAELAATGAGCRVIAVELPAGARFTGFRYEAQSAGVAADCLPGRGCPAGDCRFPNDPVLRQVGNRTVLLVAFESTAADLRRAVVAGYSTYNKR